MTDFPMTDAEPAQETPEAYASRLLAEGYNGALIAGRLVRELGLKQEDADAVVTRVAKGKVDLVGQRRLQSVIVGITSIASGAGMAAFGFFFAHVIRQILFIAFGMGLIIFGVFRLVNAISKTPESC